MTTDHVFYIPLMILAGLVMGLFLGRRSVGVDHDEDAERDGQVEGRSFFSAICRGEDDGDSAVRPG